MGTERRSKKKEILAFVIAALSAVFAALDLHGWHMYLMLGVTSAIAIVAATLLMRRLARRSDTVSAEAAASKPRGH